MYRDEYAKAGFVMLPARDPDGVRTGRQAVSHTLGLFPVSICPATSVPGLPERTVYFSARWCWASRSCWCAIRFSRELTRRARAAAFLLRSLSAAACSG